MTLDEMLEIVISSGSADWRHTVCWGAGAGPSYRDRFEINMAPPGWQLELASHSHTAALRKDLSITMSWGLRENDDFQAEWVRRFPDPNASSSYVDLFFNGALAFRTSYVSVDGGRHSLPVPRREDPQPLVASRRYAALCRLLDSFELAVSEEEYAAALARAGIVLDDQAWPR